MNIQELQTKAHQAAKSKGFYDESINVPEKLCLIHSEVSEALEAHRKGKTANCIGFSKSDEWDNETFKNIFEVNVKGSLEDELADVLIRTVDLAKYLEIDLTFHIQQKMRYNSLRSYKHGKKY